MYGRSRRFAGGPRGPESDRDPPGPTAPADCVHRIRHVPAPTSKLLRKALSPDPVPCTPQGPRGRPPGPRVHSTSIHAHGACPHVLALSAHRFPQAHNWHQPASNLLSPPLSPTAPIAPLPLPPAQPQLLLHVALLLAHQRHPLLRHLHNRPRFRLRAAAATAAAATAVGSAREDGHRGKVPVGSGVDGGCVRRQLLACSSSSRGGAGGGSKQQ